MPDGRRRRSGFHGERHDGNVGVDSGIELELRLDRQRRVHVDERVDVEWGRLLVGYQWIDQWRIHDRWIHDGWIDDGWFHNGRVDEWRFDVRDERLVGQHQRHVERRRG